jgi:hypothetical protein
MNEMTLKMVSASLDHWHSRLALVNKGTLLYCPTHKQLERVLDYDTLARAAVLSCGCKRPVFLRNSDEIQAFDRAKAERGKRQAVRVIGTKDETDK